MMKDNYDFNFAKFYNKYLTGQAKYYANFALTYLNGIDGQKKEVLDLMCGTGDLLKVFEKHNWKTTGIDASPEMLHFAKKNTKNSTLIKDNVSTIILPKNNYDLVMSTADSFNHIEFTKDISYIFSKTFKSLKKNGHFIFDINTEKGMINNCNYITSSDEWGLSIREGFFDEKNKIGFTRFQGFFKENMDEEYLRFDSKIYNYLHDIRDIKDSLINIGFTNVELLDDYSDKKYKSKLTNRVTVICTK